VEAERLFLKIIVSDGSPEEAATFRGQMLTEIARMSREDGLVMHIHRLAAQP
jgi:glucuronate isomerase